MYIYPSLHIEWAVFVTRLLDMLIILLLVKQQETDGCDLGIWICITYIQMHCILLYAS